MPLGLMQITTVNFFRPLLSEVLKLKAITPLRRARVWPRENSTGLFIISLNNITFGNLFPHGLRRHTHAYAHTECNHHKYNIYVTSQVCSNCGHHTMQIKATPIGLSSYNEMSTLTCLWVGYHYYL